LIILSREEVEQDPAWLSRAKTENVVFLSGGDAMVATTHIDLRLRAKDMGIETAIIHAPSISSAVSGLSGLQNYRFGKSTTFHSHIYEMRRPSYPRPHTILSK